MTGRLNRLTGCLTGGSLPRAAAPVKAGHGGPSGAGLGAVVHTGAGPWHLIAIGRCYNVPEQFSRGGRKCDKFIPVVKGS